VQPNWFFCFIITNITNQTTKQNLKSAYLWDWHFCSTNYCKIYKKLYFFKYLYNLRLINKTKKDLQSAPQVRKSVHVYTVCAILTREKLLDSCTVARRSPTVFCAMAFVRTNAFWQFMVYINTCLGLFSQSIFVSNSCKTCNKISYLNDYKKIPLDEINVFQHLLSPLCSNRYFL